MKVVPFLKTLCTSVKCFLITRRQLNGYFKPTQRYMYVTQRTATAFTFEVRSSDLINRASIK